MAAAKTITTVKDHHNREHCLIGRLKSDGSHGAAAQAVHREAVVVFTDAVGYSRMVALDTPGTMKSLHERHDDLFRLVGEHGGRLVNLRGDGSLLEFPQSAQALRAIMRFTAEVERRNLNVPVDRRITFRVGMASGTVLDDSQTLHGDAVNVAARLQQLAGPSAICVSDEVRHDAVADTRVDFEDLGFRELKGVRYPVRVWRVADASGSSGVALPGSEKPSIAVLPFANISGEPDQDYFADGLAEDITSSLSQSSWLFVIAHSSACIHRDADLPAAVVCRELGVRYLVTGSVRRAGGQMRITAELTDGHSGKSVWSSRFDRPVQDLFAVQDEITATIVGTIEPLYLRREEQRAVSSGPRDLQHWDLLMRARWHYWRSTRKHSVDCQRILSQAIALKPDDVTGLSLLAFSYLTDVWSGWAVDPKAVIGEAHRLSLRAVTLDDHDSFAHFTMGVAMACMGNMPRAIAEQRRALQIYPHFAAAAAELGRLLAFSGQTAEAVPLVKRAMAASPSEPRVSLWLFTLGICDFIDGDYGNAATHAAAAITHRPDWFFNHYLHAACLSAHGEQARAREALAEARRLLPRFDLHTLKVGHPFVRDEHRERYVKALKAAGWEG